MTALSMAVVAAVAEVMVRYAHSKEAVVAPQLALATFTNVAGLGLVYAYDDGAQSKKNA